MKYLVTTGHIDNVVGMYDTKLQAEQVLDDHKQRFKEANGTVLSIYCFDPEVCKVQDVAYLSMKRPETDHEVDPAENDWVSVTPKEESTNANMKLKSLLSGKQEKEKPDTGFPIPDKAPKWTKGGSDEISPLQPMLRRAMKLSQPIGGTSFL